jgi:hypothetical protein
VCPPCLKLRKFSKFDWRIDMQLIENKMYLKIIRS